MNLTNKQKEYWLNANHRWNIKTGATRSGKTYLDYFLIPKRIRERQNKKGLVVLIGNTQSTLIRNVIEPMREIYGDLLVGYIKQGNNQISLFGENCYVLGADKITQVNKLRGSSVKYCYGDEIATWNKEVFEMLKSRLDKPYSCFDGTLNPENKNHWFKKDFLDNVKEKEIDAYIQHYNIDDNTMLDKSFINSLKKEYQGTVYYQRYILGLWTNAEGLLFPQLADNSKLFEYELSEREKNFNIIDFKIVSIGMDIGGTKSNTSLIATGIKENFKSIISFDEEIIKHDKGLIDTDRICDRVFLFINKLKLKGYNVSMLWIDNAEQVIINTIRNFLIKNNININVSDCKKYDGKTRILIYNLLLNQNKMKFYKVPKTIEALSSAMYDEKSKDDKIKDDFTSDVDTFDAHFYSFSYFINYLKAKEI